jgi:DNA-binding PadR family transcriptional regulator
MFSEQIPYPDNPYKSGQCGRGGHGPRGGRGGHGGHGGHGPGGGSRGRRGRGGLRIALLTMLSEDSPKTGSELIQMLAQRGLGRRTPSPAAVYPALQMLEDDGLVNGTTPESGSGRRYELTDEGKAFIEKLGDPSVAGPRGIGWPGMSQELLELRRSVIATIAAARQIGFTGHAENAAEATALLDEARRGLYRLLAEDGPATEPATDGSTADGPTAEQPGSNDAPGEPSDTDD